MQAGAVPHDTARCLLYSSLSRRKVGERERRFGGSRVTFLPMWHNTTKRDVLPDHLSCQTATVRPDDDYGQVIVVVVRMVQRGDEWTNAASVAVDGCESDQRETTSL